MQKGAERLGVSEFFYSLQGEGRTMGVPAVFLRLRGCNLMCGGWGTERDGALYDGATWRCDTIEVWIRGKGYDFATLVEAMDAAVDFRLRMRQGAHLVVTGGEPLLQQERLLAFLSYLEAVEGLRPVVEVETNATVLPLAALDERVHYWNTSPKLSNSGMGESVRIYPKILAWFGANPKTMSKFVLSSEADWLELERDFLARGLVNRSQLVLMAAASSSAALREANQWLADLCIRECLRMSSRLHVELWNELTGR